MTTTSVTGGARPGTGRLPRTVTWGLVAAWALPGAEVPRTMAGWADRARPRLEQYLPWVPTSTWDRLSVPQEHATAAIGVMARVIGTAAARSARTNGRSPFFQAVLARRQPEAE